jgi:hypothetical protein
MQNLLAVFDMPEPERTARLREARLAALLLLGRKHTLTAALTEAIADPAALVRALAKLDALAALPRRRLLATLASVLPARVILEQRLGRPRAISLNSSRASVRASQ